jgi:HSP20 family protein
VKNEQVDLAVVGNELTVKVERPAPERQETTFHRQERPTGSFSRTLRLPTEVAVDKVEATLQQGVLTIRLPKAEAARPRKISVQAS